MRVLVTLGGTRERIDDVRFISNLSTGRTGSAIADGLRAAGFSVACLCGKGSERPTEKGIRISEFSDFRDLDRKIKGLLGTSAFDAVVHLAAVGDYSVDRVRAGGRTYRPGRRGKMPSASPSITLVLKRNFKILDRIKGYALRRSGASAPALVGFKLTSGLRPSAAAAAVRELRAADLVVHNDLSEMRGAHPFHIYRSGERVRDCRDACELAGALAGYLRTDKKEAKCC